MVLATQAVKQNLFTPGHVSYSKNVISHVKDFTENVAEYWLMRRLSFHFSIPYFLVVQLYNQRVGIAEYVLGPNNS